MRNFKTLSLVGLLCWFTSYAYGQQIRGEVYDKNNHAPLPGASVTVSGTNGVTTDADGKFSFDAKGAKSFTVSTVGYTSKKVSLTTASFYSIGLESSNQALDQVVVVGYGTQRKVDLTGAVATVDIKKTFDSKPFND